MSFRDRFKKKESSLTNQQTSQSKSADSKGNFPSIISKSKLPAGVEVWKIKEGLHCFDILPFYAGSNFPLDEDGQPKVAKDDLAYIVDLEMHSNIGTNRTPYVCPNRNFGLPCPICEFIADNNLSTDDWAKVSPKRRALYLIWVHDTVESEKKGIQILDISWHQMEKLLAAIAANPKGGGAIQFAHPYNGKSIAFKREGTGMKNTSYIGHRFVDRDMQIPEKLLDMTFPLDDYIKMHPTYEEIETAFQGQRKKLDGIVSGDDNAGNTFSGGGAGTGDDVPDWMKDPDDKETPETAKSEIPKPETTKKRFVIRKK